MADTVARLRAKAALERGRHFFNTERFGEALAAFDEAALADPTFLRAYTAKAHALSMLGRAEEAAALCDEVIAKDPRFCLAFSTKGSALQRLGRTEEARRAYERAIELGPDDPLVHYNFACFWAVAGDAAACARHLKRAIDLDPKQNTKAATDGDFVVFRNEKWFQDLVAFR